MRRWWPRRRSSAGLVPAPPRPCPCYLHRRAPMPPTDAYPCICECDHERDEAVHRYLDRVESCTSDPVLLARIAELRAGLDSTIRAATPSKENR